MNIESEDQEKRSYNGMPSEFVKISEERAT